MSCLQAMDMHPANASDQGGEHKPSALLSLPPAVLSAHVWPHLGPWARAQLRATCKALQSEADRLLGPELRVHCFPEVRPHCAGSGQCSLADHPG